MNKRCTQCGETKNISEFASAGKGKKRAQCKPCLARKKREYYKKNPDKARRRNLLTYYGITLEQFDKMVEAQNHCCAACGTHTDVLHVDHNHITGELRELLCMNCNLALGHVKDSVERLIQLRDYALKHST